MNWRGDPHYLVTVGRDVYQTYARTRVEHGFFSCPFRPKHRKISRKCPEMALFFRAKARLRATLAIFPTIWLLVGIRLLF